jgi:hypothetical protein
MAARRRIGEIRHQAARETGAPAMIGGRTLAAVSTKTAVRATEITIATQNPTRKATGGFTEVVPGPVPDGCALAG